MKPLLASKLINALSNPKRGLSGYMGGSIADEMANKTQIEIVQSQKFVISPSLVNHAVRASFSKPSVLLDMLNQGKPPYNNLWLEWDEDYRQDCLQTVHKENGKDFSEVKTNPNKVGYHIQLITDELGDEHFLYTAYGQFGSDDPDVPTIKRNQFYSLPMSFILYNNASPTFEDIQARNELLDEVPREWVVQNEEAWFFEGFKHTFTLMANWYSMENLPKALNIVDGDVLELDQKKFKKLMNYNKSHEFNCFKEISKRISIGQSACMHWIITKQKFLAGYEKDEMEFYIKHSLDSLGGDARFIIALFGLLNSDITTTEEVEPNNKLIYTQFGKRVPRNAYKVLNVNLSDTKVRKIYKSKFTGVKKRQHERRGHWRNYTNGKRIWINSFLAGDPEIGIVTKDYNFNIGEKDDVNN